MTCNHYNTLVAFINSVDKQASPAGYLALNMLETCKKKKK